MTERQRDDEAGSGEPPPRRRKRKAKTGRKASAKAPRREVLREALATTEPPPAKPSRYAVPLGGMLVVALVLYATNALGDAQRSYVLVASGVLAAVFTMASGLAPRYLILGSAGTAAIGLAIAGTTPHPLGGVLCMVGGLGLAGSIHVLGRLGPPDVGPPDVGPPDVGPPDVGPPGPGGAVPAVVDGG